MCTPTVAQGAGCTDDDDCKISMICEDTTNTCQLLYTEDEGVNVQDPLRCKSGAKEGGLGAVGACRETTIISQSGAALLTPYQCTLVGGNICQHDNALSAADSNPVGIKRGFEKLAQTVSKTTDCQCVYGEVG